jgi:hypothetical protein
VVENKAYSLDVWYNGKIIDKTMGEKEKRKEIKKIVLVKNKRTKGLG